MEKAMDMSLDDYIASFKAERKNNGVKSDSNGKFKADRRSYDEDELLVDSDEETNEIWKGPDASTAYIDLDMPDKDIIDAMASDEQNDFGQNLIPTSTQNQLQNSEDHRFQPQFDLRNKISRSKGIKPDLNPDFNSQQWRLMQPNINQRPAGIPPLVPQVVFEEVRTRHKRGGKRFWKRTSNRNAFINKNGFCNGSANGNANYVNGNGNNKGGGYGNGSGYGITNSNGVGNANLNNSYSNNDGCNQMLNHGRIQRFTQRPTNQEIKKNVNAVLERLNRPNGHVLPTVGRNLTIECAANSINLSSTPYPRSTMKRSDANVKPQLTKNTALKMPVQGPLQVSDTSGTINKSNDSLRALLGINDTNAINMDMMPILASKVLDFFQNFTPQTTHKPIYDIQLQREIRNIQKKPLLYKCPGGEIVSSDGSGINCKVIPRTSGISFNQRFA